MDSKTRTLLIVTRERLLADLLGEVLRARGYSCTTETDPTAAVGRFRDERPALTIVDVGSLGREGLDIAADLRLVDVDAAVLALIGAGQSTLESMAYSLGVTDILRRQEDMAEILRAVNEFDQEPSQREGAEPIPDDGRTSESQLGPGDTGMGTEVPILDEPATVLAVDDDAGVRRFLERVLTRDGYRVLTARDGVEALECLDRESVQLMFLDLRLPRLGGLAVLRRLRERGSQPRTIIISGLTDHELVQQTIQLGAFDYLRKPLGVDRVLVAASSAFVLEQARRRSFWDRLKRRLS